MVKKGPYTEEEVFFDTKEPKTEEISVTQFMNQVVDYGEWKELIGYLKGKNLNPKLVRKYIEAVLEIEKSSV